MTNPPVMVAMSGGVDSSVAAARVLASGAETVGITLKLWGGESDTGCCAVSDVDDARRVAQQLDIAHHVFNFGDAFTEHVVEPYVADHAAGRTPNPCIECNRHVKFDALLHRATALGFDVVATGHHARIAERDDGTLRLRRGADLAKDQSYVLYMLGQDVLRRVRFPVGDSAKDEVRREAESLALRTADKPDSQDVCFITRTGGRRAFLGDRIPLRPGVIVDDAGSVVGEVPAVQLVTLGQRKGLGLGGGPPRFVTGIDIDTGVVTVGAADELLVDEATVEQVVWADAPAAGRYDVQCAAHGEPALATVEVLAGDRAVVRWEQPHRRIAPGQSLVFYHGDEVEGGGLSI